LWNLVVFVAVVVVVAGVAVDVVVVVANFVAGFVRREEMFSVGAGIGR